MNNRTNKKARKVLREKIQVEGKDIAISLQSLILRFTFKKRASIAWKILRGKPFLGGTGQTIKTKEEAS